MQRDGDGGGGRHVHVADGLQVEVRLSAITRVAAVGHGLPHRHLLAVTDPDAVLLQVTQHNDGASAGLEHHVVPGQGGPACRSPAGLAEGVTDRRQTTEGRMIGFRIVHGDDQPVDRRQHGPTEPNEVPTTLNLASGQGASIAWMALAMVMLRVIHSWVVPAGPPVAVASGTCQAMLIMVRTTTQSRARRSSRPAVSTMV